MGTAVKGVSVDVTERGRVDLNSKVSLLDVAVMPKASISLISIGRLCDAGLSIFMDKNVLEVYPPNSDKVLLTGKRVGRLWVMTVNGTIPPKQSATSLVIRKRKYKETAVKEAAESTAASSHLHASSTTPTLSSSSSSSSSSKTKGSKQSRTESQE
jgi:hypothetical protein